MEDWRGLSITGGSEAARAAIDDFCEGFLAHETRAANVLAVADAEPDCPLANAYAAMLHMFMETRAAPATARPYLERAEASAARATGRERMVIATTRAWVDGDIGHAIAIGEEASGAFPRDLALAKVTQYHQFNLGDAPGMLRVAGRVIDANRDVAYAHGLLAFAYEECHLLADAEAAARAALAQRADEPWAQHALAHVMLTNGRNDEGRAFLDAAKHGWERLNSFMHTHNWWHLALFQIEQGDAASVLDDYDEHIWGVWKEYSQDQIGAVSLLARLELAGLDVGDRWRDVASYLAARVEDHVQPFLSAQYLYGLARAERDEAPAMLDAIRRTAATARPIARAAWTEVCVPLCEGLLAHARGDFAQASDRFDRSLPRLIEIGGSHAQRDLFHQIATDSSLRAGRLIAAQQALAQRHAHHPHSAPTTRSLAEVYRRIGLPREAERLNAG